MTGIKAGIVLVSKFVRPYNEKFSEYINYIDRHEATRNVNIKRFNLFHDYMGNPVKTGGLFTSDKDRLTLEERQKYKNIFRKPRKMKVSCGKMCFRLIIGG